MGFLFAAAAAHFAAFLSDEDGWVKNKQIDGTNYLRQRGEERKKGFETRRRRRSRKCLFGRNRRTDRLTGREYADTSVWRVSL